MNINDYSVKSAREGERVGEMEGRKVWNLGEDAGREGREGDVQRRGNALRRQHSAQGRSVQAATLYASKF